MGLVLRLVEVDEQCVFLKDTLYSLLTSGSGPPKIPPSLELSKKKPLKPLKATMTAPWNLAVMPSGP